MSSARKQAGDEEGLFLEELRSTCIDCAKRRAGTLCSPTSVRLGGCQAKIHLFFCLGYLSFLKLWFHFGGGLGDASCMPLCPGYPSIPGAAESAFCRGKDGVAVLEKCYSAVGSGAGVI